MELNGKHNKEESWEKQNVYDLDNGYRVTVEYNQHYGDMVSRIDAPDETYYWHCSNGKDGLPEFAREWIKPVAPGHWMTLVRPLFNKVYGD